MELGEGSSNESIPFLAEEEIVEEFELQAREARRQVLVANIFVDVFTVFAIVSITVNVIIALVILKYKRLRLKKANILILNFVVFDTIFMICIPIAIRFQYHYYNSKVIFFVTEIESTLLQGTITSIILLTVHWYLKLYHSERAIKFEKRLNLILTCLYVFVAFCTGLVTNAYYQNSLMYVRLGTVILFLAYIVFMVVINIVHFVKKRNLVDYRVAKMCSYLLSNVVFLSKLPVLVTIIIYLIIVHTANGFTIIFITFCITAILASVNGIYCFVILYKFDKDFNLYFRHTFSCKRNEYSEEIREHSVAYSDTDCTVLVHGDS